MKTKSPTEKALTKTGMAGAQQGLLMDVRGLILGRGVNAALVTLYWKIGQRIRGDILKERRAEYGQEIVATLSQQLSAEFGNGFSRFNLSRMIRFAEMFADRD